MEQMKIVYSIETFLINSRYRTEPKNCSCRCWELPIRRLLCRLSSRATMRTREMTTYCFYCYLPWKSFHRIYRNLQKFWILRNAVRSARGESKCINSAFPMRKFSFALFFWLFLSISIAFVGFFPISHACVGCSPYPVLVLIVSQCPMLVFWEWHFVLGMTLNSSVVSWVWR